MGELMSTTLRYPYSFEARKPAYIWPVLFVPEFYQDEKEQAHLDFFDPEWERVLFHPHLRVEFCSGTGAWLIENALRYPEVQWIGVDLKYDRVQKIHNKIQKYHLKNCVAVLGQAEIFTRYYLKEHSVEQVYVNFPDPWPKKKHAKNRLMQAPFLTSIKKVLTPGGKLTFVTDDTEYLKQGILAMQSDGWSPALESPFYQPLASDYGTSFFETLWSSKGKINYLTQFYSA